jgi:sugar phosphate isomerase/epimerase
MSPLLSIQLYTVRNLIAQRGFAAVVRDIAAIGYPAVETAGFPGTDAVAAAKLFRELGLQSVSGHFPMPLGDQKNKALDEARTIGAKYVISGKGPDDFKTLDLIKQSCAEFNEAAANAAAAGLTFAIHNHWWEFQMLNGRRVYECMLEHLQPNPAEVVRRLGRRAPLLHIKDGPCVTGQPMTAVGDGRVDFGAIAKASQADVWVVELDECATDMMEAVRRSYRYLTGHRLAAGKTATPASSY